MPSSSLLKRILRKTFCSSLQTKTNKEETKLTFSQLVNGSNDAAVALRLKKDLNDLTWTSKIKEAYDHDENLMLMVNKFRHFLKNILFFIHLDNLS